MLVGRFFHNLTTPVVRFDTAKPMSPEQVEAAQNAQHLCDELAHYRESFLSASNPFPSGQRVGTVRGVDGKCHSGSCLDEGDSVQMQLDQGKFQATAGGGQISIHKVTYWDVDGVGQLTRPHSLGTTSEEWLVHDGSKGAYKAIQYPSVENWL